MYKCYFIGATSLLKECISVAQEHSFQVLGVLSDDLNINKWCQSVNLKCEPTKNIKELMKSECDYLFSIVNSKIISPPDLVNVKKHAINYHDSLLPKYAGINATTWAIINNEKNHGITWHLISEGIDTGDIVRQDEIIIEKNETAFSLNLKCYNEAIRSFPLLLNDLIRNKVSLTKQNTKFRSYYSRQERPFGNGFINWNDSANNIIRLIHALDFGISNNPQTTSKIIINDKPYFACNATIINATQKMKPGTVISHTNNNLIIATADNYLSINEIKTLEGNTQSFSDIASTTNKIPIKIATLSNVELEKTQSFAMNVSKCESYWIQQIQNITLSSNSLLTGHTQHQEEKLVWTLDITKKILHTVNNHTNNDLLNTVIALISFYFYRINNYQPITVKILKYFYYGYENYPVALPCNIELNHSDDIFGRILNNINQLFKNHVYEPDLFCRNLALTNSLESVPILIDPTSDIHSKQKLNHQGLIIKFNFSNNKVILTCKSTIQFSPRTENLLKFMPQHLENLITQINIKKNPVYFSILSKEEEIVLEAFNTTKTKVSQNQTLLQKILFRLEENPNAIAVVEHGKTYTYKELLCLSNTLANQIRKSYQQYFNRNLSTQKAIAIYCQNGLSYTLSILASLRLGCIFTPIDPSYPNKRVQYILDDSQCSIVINDTPDKNLQISSTLIYNLEVDELKQITNQNEINLLEHQHLIYIMYTSGSTGEPKGVKVSHYNFNNLLEWYIHLCLTNTDKTLVVSSFAFDLTQKNIFAPLMAGGQVHFRNNKQYYEPKEILEQISTYKITHINCTNSLFFHLTENIHLLYQLESLLHVVLGVGLFNGHTLLELLKSNPKVKIYNSYGPAECTDVCSCYTITKEDIINNNPIPISPPINNNEIFILDKYHQIMPLGVPGELCVTGMNVSQGYLGKNDLTTKVFIKNNLMTSKYDGLRYHTGDIAYLNTDRKLYFLNRTDNQIKIRGYRVELGEVEAVLVKHPKIKEAKVICHEVEDNKSLIAFVTPAISPNINQEEAYNHLKEYLPQYMLPHSIYIIDQLPLTRHDKIDQDALQKIASEKSFSIKILPPTRPIENKLCQIWSTLLNTSIETINLNFFEIGGDSLLATKLAYKIEEECNVPMKTIDIYQHPILLEQATFITNKNKNDTSLMAQSQSILQPKLLSEQQKSIIFLEKMHPEFSYLYNSLYCFKINGDLKIEYLKKSIEIAYNSLPILKENYSIDSSSNLKKIHNNLPIDISILNITEDKIQSYLINKKINISEDNLFSVYIFLINPTSTHLYFKIHHCISDAESIGIICKYITQLYEAMIDNTLPPTIDQKYNYDQYALWQKNYILTNQYQQSVEAYANYLKNLTPTTLPYDNIPQGKFIFTSQCDFFELENRDLYPRIYAFCNQKKISLFTFLWATISLQIHQYNSKESIFAGSFAANRYPGRFSETIGLFANLFILRADINPEHTFTNYALNLHTDIIDNISYQHVMTKHLFQKLKLENQDNVSAVTPLGIEFINRSQLKDLQFINCTVKSEIVDYSNCKFNLSFRFFQESDQRFTCIIEYNKHMFNTETILRFKKHFINIIDTIMASPDTLIKNICSLTKNELKTMKNRDLGHNLQIEHKGIVTDLLEIEDIIHSLGQSKKCACVFHLGKFYLFITPSSEYNDELFAKKLYSYLPYHITVDKIIKLDKIPTTPDGNFSHNELITTYISDDNQSVKNTSDNTILNLVSAAYKKALGLNEIDIDKDFYALGGDSMMGVELVDDLEVSSNIIIDIESFFQYPTIRSLSNYIRRSTNLNKFDTPNNITKPNKTINFEPISLFNKTKKTYKNIFCVHPVANIANAYLHFSQYFDGVQFYAINSYNYHRPNKIMNINELATLYNYELMKYQNEGPYYLAGWSYGGIIAYEMAQQLTIAGKEVAVVYLLDSFALSKASVSNLPKLSNYFFNMLKEFSTEIAENLSLQQHLEQMLRIEFTLMSQYQFKPYQGPVILFKARDAFEYPLVINDKEKQFFIDLQQEVLNDPSNGFVNLVPKLKILLINTHHHRLLNHPYGLQIANEIEKDIFDRAVVT